MRNIFSLDNPIMQTLSKIADLMILNVTFIICCLPVFTIGAALTGLSYVSLKMAENEEGYIFKGFLKSFKQNFKQATVIWLIMLAIGLVLGADFYILSASSGTFITTIRVILVITAFIYLMIMLYVFPTLARFYNSTKNTLRNAFLMSIADFPRTLIMLVITVGSVLITLYNGYTLAYGLLIWILGGFALVSYLNSFFLKKVFAKYTPKEENAEESNPDNWVLDENEEISEIAEKTAEENAEKTE